MPALIALVIWVLVAGLIFAVAWWGVNAIGMPEPFRMVARGILVILAVIILLYLLMGILPAFPALHR